MKPFYLLLTVFGLSAIILRISLGYWDFTDAGNIAMGTMLLFTALGHFKFTDGMMMMVPRFVPFKKLVVFASGIFEIAAGIALYFPALRYITGIILLIFFVLMLPANINAAVHRVDYEKANYNGPGPAYLWFRVPLQLLFIAWVYYFSIYPFLRMHN